MSQRSNVTVVDIAKRAKVSQATVSAALHGRGRVGQECRERIVTIARQMGYEPKVAAQLLRAKRSGHIGLIVAASDGIEAMSREVQRLVVGHFVNWCGRHDVPYHIEFHHHLQDDKEPFQPPVQVTARMVDGTILVGDVGDPLRTWLGEYSGFPWVSIEEPALHCVLSASDQACQQAMEHLFGLGHRRFGFVGGVLRYSQQRLAREAFESFITEKQLIGQAKICSTDYGISDEVESIRAVKDWASTVLTRDDRPTGIFCHGEPLARAVLHAAAELGLRVPQDLSVLSYGSRFEARRRYPHLTTIENDYEQITHQAMEMLRLNINEQPIENPRRLVSPKLIPGATVGPVPG